MMMERIEEDLPKGSMTKWMLALTATVLIILGFVIAIAFGPKQPIIVNPQFVQPDPIADTGTGEGVFGGWVNDEEAREAVMSSLPVKYFRDTPAFKAFRGDDTKDVLLTDAALAVRGSFLPIRDQKDVGSCVSFGTACAIEHLMLIQMAESMKIGLPPPIDFKDLSQEVIYGGSRVQVGNGKLGRGDGSVTAWAGQFVKQWGVVSRAVYGKYDLSNYSTTTCRQFGANGVPSDIQEVAKLSPVKTITFIKTAEEADKAIRQGYPIAVGSSVGFGSRGPWPRDKDGFLKANGSWGHCMAVLGVVTVNGRKGFLWMNSWTDQVHRGPNGGKNIPEGGCFFVDWNTANRMFGEGDAIAFSDAVGFPAKNDFFIYVDPQKRPFQKQQDVLVQNTEKDHLLLRP